MVLNQNRRPSMLKQFTGEYLLVSILPVVLFFIFTVVGFYLIQHHATEFIKNSVYDLSEDAREQLEVLGQSIIQTKARDVARQIGIYLRENPHADILRLQRTQYFKDLALQKVGQTGYTCLYEAGTGIMRIHPDSKLIDRPMSFLSEKIPSWWALFEPTLTGIELSGYYDWIESDGTMRKKYMTMTPVGEPLNGIILMIAATAYIDEFSTPSLAMRKKAKEIGTTYQTSVHRLVLIVGSSITIILFVAFMGIYFLGRRSARRYMVPVVNLANAARKIGEGDWETGIDAAILERKDEIGDLAVSFNGMRRQLKRLFHDLESRLAELKATQSALKKSEKYYRSLFDGVPVGLYRTTPDGQIIDANPTLINMLAYPSKDQLLSRKAMDIYVNPEDRVTWQTRVEGQHGENIYETKMRRYDGKEIWVEIHSVAVNNEQGQVLYYEGSLKDVTERKNTGMALLEGEEKYRQLYNESKRAEEMYRSLLNSSADAIVTYDLEGKAQYVSPAFTKLFGWSLDEVAGKRIPFLPESEKNTTIAIIQDVVRGMPCQGYETKRLTKDGRLIDISISASRFEDHEEKPAGLLVILRDISEKKKLEEQLQLVQRMESIGTLAGGIAHDFNNLMMGILGNVELMMYRKDDVRPIIKYLYNIEKLVHSGSRLTNQLLGYARKGKYELKSIDLNLAVKECAETFGRTRKEIAIHTDFHEEKLIVEVDRSQIEQVLFNLYVNAADAMPKGGNLYLKTSVIGHHDMQNKPYEPNPGYYALLEISDTGMGMDPETRSRIFDPFFTTKEMGRGTGLGLAAAYGIVKAHSGYIEVESQPNRGSTFRIYLRASTPQISPESKKTLTIEAGDGTILLIDDEHMVLEVVNQMIKKMGYKVLSADNSTQALSIFRENKNAVDLVILDLIMPDSYGGDTYDELKRINPDIKVLLSSGYSMDGQAIDIMNRGCNGFIQKPYEMGALSRKINEILKDNRA